MKRLFCLLFSVVLTGMLFAQVGFIDHEGYVVIEPKYKSALPFSEGVAVVETFKGYKQFIDANGNVVIKMKFLDAKSFREGLAPVMESKEKGWGYINKQGKYVIAPNPKITYVDSFSEGLSMIVEEYSTTKYIRRDGSVHLITTGGRSFSEGYAVTGKHVKDATGKEKSKYGFIDKFGKWIIEPKYDIAFSFSEGLAMVGMEDEKGNKTIQFIEPSGSVRIEMPEKMRSDSEGVRVSYDENRPLEFQEGYVAIQMEDIITPSDDEIHFTPYIFSGIIRPHAECNNLMMSKRGEIIAPPTATTIITELSEGKIIGWSGMHYDFLTSTLYLNAIIGHWPEGNWILGPYKEGLAVFQVDTRFYGRNNRGKWDKYYKKGSNIFTENHIEAVVPEIFGVLYLKDGKWVRDFWKKEK